MPKQKRPFAAHPTQAELQILLSLGENALHGYGIKQQVEARTAGELRLGSGTLYEAIQRLEASGCIQEAPMPEKDQSGRRKRLYELTPRGRQTLEAELSRLAQIVRYARDKNLLPETQ